MNAAEAIVVAQLESWGFRSEPFSKAQLRASKTPDRKVYGDQEFVFFLEVKEIAANGFAGGLRNDSRFNRLASDIYTAVKQFDAVNADRQHPNILAFINNDSLCSPSDLTAVLTGEALTDDGENLPIHGREAFGRLAEPKLRIDGYIWFDGSVPAAIVHRSLFRQRASTAPRRAGYLQTTRGERSSEVRPSSELTAV